MAVLDIAADARRAVDTVKAGGIVVFPTDVGYAGTGGCEAALTRFFQAKGRGAHKRNAMLGSMAIHEDVHAMPARVNTMIRALVEDYDLPISAIGPYRPGHPLLRKLGDEALAASTEGGTVAILMNVGPLEHRMATLAVEEGQPLFGSSANLSLHGTKFRVEDMESEITAIADVAIDYGLMKYHPWQSSSTLIHCETLEVVRYGSCFENIADILKRHFRIELPPRPAKA